MENGKNLIHSFSNGNFQGLNKREYFAGLAMQGICANVQNWSRNTDEIITASIKMADALLKELENNSNYENCSSIHGSIYKQL
jgi:hypothetical protein